MKQNESTDDDNFNFEGLYDCFISRDRKNNRIDVSETVAN